MHLLPLAIIFSKERSTLSTSLSIELPSGWAYRCWSVLLIIFTTLTVHAQTNYADYVGQTVDALSFEQAIAKLPKYVPRGEYETTAQYEARRAAEMGDTGGPLIILKEPEDRDKHIRYDADAGQLDLSRYAFDNKILDAWHAFYGTPHAKSLNASTIGNYEVVISQSEQTSDTYIGQNAYGASWEIMRITRIVQAIYERGPGPRDYGSFSSLFPTADDSPYMVGHIQMSPEIAQHTKPTLKLAFVVVPREPYVVHSQYTTQTRISREYPFDVTYDATILIGDIQWGLVLDASNRVLAAYPTR